MKVAVVGYEAVARLTTVDDESVLVLDSSVGAEVAGPANPASRARLAAMPQSLRSGDGAWC